MLALPLIVAAVVAAFGLFGAYVAVQKDRSPYEGFIFGAALGPIGILVVVLLPDGDRYGRPAPRRSPLRSDTPADVDWLKDPAKVVGRMK